MSQNCYDNKPLTIPVTNCVDCQPPQVSCADGEECPDATRAACVIYDEEPLDNIGVKTNDRLDDILRKLNVNRATQAISTEDTETVDLSGNGLSSNKLKADVKVSPASGNIIEKTTQGLFATIDKDKIKEILNIIHDDDELRYIFCSIVSQCVDFTCSLSTNLNVEMN